MAHELDSRPLTDEEAERRLLALEPDAPGVVVTYRTDLERVISAQRRLEALTMARKVADRHLHREVRAARASGVTWTTIAGALGVSHQAVMKRFGTTEPTTDDNAMRAALEGADEGTRQVVLALLGPMATPDSDD